MSFCILLFCTFRPPPHPRAWASCVQDLLWSGADVPPWSWLPCKQVCCEKESGEVALSPSICAPSAHESGAAFTPHVVPAWASCRHAVRSLVPGLSYLAGWTSDLLCHCQCVWLSLGYASPILLSIFRQGGTGPHAGEDTALLALLLPRLLAPCPLQGSSPLILHNMKITGCIFSYLDHGKCSGLSDAQKMDVWSIL